jgi:uncharacterized protein (TIGR02594 family)
MTRIDACQKLHDVALAELGVHETPGPEATARILEYTKHTTLDAQSDETAWCASFANFVTDTAGFPGTHSAAAASFQNWGVELEAPILGCIVVWPHHVTFCDHPDISNDIIRCLGGNQSNSVKVSRFPVADAKFRSPV